MEQIRKPFQGVLNIIRFNWHFYIIGCCSALFIFFIANYFEKPYTNFIYVFGILVLSSIIVSLLVSLYVYDFSGFYRLDWIKKNDSEKIIINISAGFDETSHLLKEKFKDAKIISLDFYNPEEHTEVSIKRARKAYPAYKQATQIKTSNTELPNDFADKIFVILSAHEIRSEIERTEFFIELKRILKSNGKIYVTEHLRDLSNFMAYNFGFFHFHSKTAWRKNFMNANLKIIKEIKLTYFISTFIIEKNGNSL